MYWIYVYLKMTWYYTYWEKHRRFSIFNTGFFTLFNVSELSFVRMVLYNHIYYKNNKHLHVLTLCVSSIIFYLELSVAHWTRTYHYFVMALYCWCGVFLKTTFLHGFHFQHCSYVDILVHYFNKLVTGLS